MSYHLTAAQGRIVRSGKDRKKVRRGVQGSLRVSPRRRARLGDGDWIRKFKKWERYVKIYGSANLPRDPEYTRDRVRRGHKVAEDSEYFFDLLYSLGPHMAEYYRVYGKFRTKRLKLSHVKILTQKGLLYYQNTYNIMDPEKGLDKKK